MVCHWIFQIQIPGQDVWLQVNTLTFVSEIRELQCVSFVTFLFCYFVWFSVQIVTTRCSGKNH